MTIAGIVVRPVDDRKPPRVRNELAADLDAVARAYRARGRDAHVVDDLEPPRAALYVECLMLAVRARSVEEARARYDGRAEIDPRSHWCCDHARLVERQDIQTWR